MADSIQRVGALVFEIRPDLDPSRQSSDYMTFLVLPRVGDTIVKDDEKGIGRVYQVVDVHLPDEPPLYKEDGVECAGDIFIVHRGTILDRVDEQKQRAETRFIAYNL